MSLRSFLPILALLGTVFTGFAHGATVRFDLGGAVSYMGSSGLPVELGSITSEVKLGDSFDVALTFETVRYSRKAATFPESSARYEYRGGTGFAVDALLGASKTASARAGDITLNNNNASVGDQIQFLVLDNQQTPLIASQIDGQNWFGLSVILRDETAALFSVTDLPTSMWTRDSFSSAIARLNTGPNDCQSGGFIEAAFNSLRVTVTDTASAQIDGQGSVDVLALAGGGALSVTTSAAGDFTASYSKQSVDQVAPGTFNFLIPGAAYQYWDLAFSGDLGDDGFVDLLFAYDDVGMTTEEEAALDIFHELSPGVFERLFGLVDVQNNTISARTTSFSPFHLGGVAVTANDVPTPSTLMLVSLGLLIAARRHLSRHAS